MRSNKFRWDSYVLFKNSKEINAFWCEHYRDNSHKTLFILGKGFDIRMNLGIKNLLENNQIQVKTLLVEFDEGRSSASHDYEKYVEKNTLELESLSSLNIEKREITLWKGSGRKKRRIGDREAADNIIMSYDEINEYSDIILDISALPRGIYFSLIGKILLLIDNHKSNGNELHNFFIVTSENAKIDSMTQEEVLDEDLNYTHGFGGGLDLTSEVPIIWFPILGENKTAQILNANKKINPREICPLLPFPSKDPRRSDQLIIEYHRLLFDELRIEGQNLMYVPEQNPFEVYRSLCSAIINYNESLKILNGCKAAISTFSSKLLSIGALLAAYELTYCNESDKIGVGLLNIDSQGYRIDDEELLTILKNESELFLTWLTGEPYNL
ncbi:MAG: hypothetical protein ABR927_16235 [Bacteroidales bacterium]